MKVFSPTDNDFVKTTAGNKRVRLLKQEVFENFDPSFLGLGDIKKESEAIPAIAAVEAPARD
jgi:hypothetical protein